MAAGGDDAGVQQVGDFFHHHLQAAGVAKIFHQVLARGLQIQQARQFRGQMVEVVNAQRHTQSTSDGDQMDHRVGGAANGCQCFDGVFKSFTREDGGEFLVGMHHLDDATACIAGQHIATAVHSGVGGVAGQTHAQGLDHAGHGGCCAHGHAVAVAAVHAALGFKEVSQLQGACTNLLAHAPHAGTGAKLLATPFAVEHGAAAHTNGGQVNAGRAHDERWGGFVAAHEQHHAINGVAANAFFHVHAGQVAVKHGGGAKQGLTQRHDGKFKGKATGLVDPDLDLLCQGAEMRVARREFAESVANTDDGAAIELVMRHTLALDPAAVGKAIAVLATKPLLRAKF